MLLHEFRSDPHIIAFLILAIIFFLLSRTPLASAQEISSGFVPDPSPERSGEIAGVVFTDGGDASLVQVIITVRSASLGTSRSILSDTDGTFRMRGLSEGTYQIMAEAEGYDSASATAQVGQFPSDISLHLKAAHPAYSSANGPSSVSVHDLKIPSKAHEEYERGIADLVKKDPVGSLAHLNKAVQIFPSYYEAYYHIGVAEVRLNHLHDAMNAFQRAIDISGGHYAVAQFAYGLLLSDQGMPADGERVIRAGLESNPESAEGHLFLAITLFSLKRMDEAETSARAALVRKPGLADAYLVLSDIHAQRNEHFAQLQDLDSFLKLAPRARQAQEIRQIRDAVQRLATGPSLVN